MGIFRIASTLAITIQPHERAERQLRRDEHDAHENVSGREMMVDGRSERRSTHGQPPRLRNEEVGAEKCDQPNDNQKNEAHLRENPPGQIFDLSHVETGEIP